MVVLLVGMIASGKSSFVKTLAERGNIIINDDSLVMGCHGGNYTLYRKDYKSIYKAAELSIMTSALANKIDVVVDRPNMKVATRRRYIGIAQMFDQPIVVVTFPRHEPLVHAERRFNSDSRGLSLEYWIRVAESHANEWQEPKFSEGFDNIVDVSMARQMIESGNW